MAKAPPFDGGGGGGLLLPGRPYMDETELVVPSTRQPCPHLAAGPVGVPVQLVVAYKV